VKCKIRLDSYETGTNATPLQYYNMYKKGCKVKKKKKKTKLPHSGEMSPGLPSVVKFEDAL
jgi:hypothetical protein